MVDQILGARKCIGGAQYAYAPPTTSSAAAPAAESTVSSPDTVPADTLAVLQAMAQVLIPENTYVGAYRYFPKFQIDASVTNREVLLGFPVRVFRIDCETPITIRLNSVQGDEIPLDHQKGPFELRGIPKGLAFDRIYVTNPVAQVISIEMFMMG